MFAGMINIKRWTSSGPKIPRKWCNNRLKKNKDENPQVQKALQPNWIALRNRRLEVSALRSANSTWPSATHTLKKQMALANQWTEWIESQVRDQVRLALARAQSDARVFLSKFLGRFWGLKNRHFGMKKLSRLREEHSILSFLEKKLLHCWSLRIPLWLILKISNYWLWLVLKTILVYFYFL